MNFTRRADVISMYKNNERYYFKHDINNADTPEILADKLYDNANYAWIILPSDTGWKYSNHSRFSRHYGGTL